MTRRIGRVERVTRLLVASQNPGKLAEMQKLAAGLHLEIVAPRDVGLLVAPEETGRTFLENAELKARHYSLASGLVTVADDSGICVEALGGEPGLHSARFGGLRASDADRNRLLLEKLAGVPPARRGARFVSAVAVARGEEIAFAVQETADGRIADAPAGENGFGYDPLFFFPPLGRTFGQLDPAEKDRVSHRGKAFAALRTWLRSTFPA